ncbi:MAG: lipopolysaccharide heptosyltransferase II [Isosphaeraceae bacterium]
MATPTLRALRDTYREARIIAVSKPQVAATLEGGRWFDETVVYDPKSDDRARKSWTILSRLRTERFDLAVLFPNSFRSGLMAWLAGASRRIGYDRGDRGKLLTDRLTYKTDDHGRRVPSPILEDYLAIARRLGCRVDSLKTELDTTSADESAADRVWKRLGLPKPSTDRIVCLNTGGAFGPAKNWPNRHFADLAQRLVDNSYAHVLVICGPSERDSAAEIARLSKRPEVVSLADEALGVGLSKACVRRASLLITTDSGPRHFAEPFNVPVLTLFGPTHIAWTRSHNPGAKHIYHPVSCGPCQKPICPLGHGRCMTELSPAAVFKAAHDLLRSRASIDSHPSLVVQAGEFL